MKLVKNHHTEYGLNRCLAAIGLPKSTWYYWQNDKLTYEEKYCDLRQPIVDAVRDHPFYGYRRMVPELQERGYDVGEYVVRRLFSHWNLGLYRGIKKPKPSPPREMITHSDHGWNRVAKIKDPQPFEVLATDFTEILYNYGNKKAYLMPILDHATKLIPGWAVSPTKDTDLALEALKRTHEEMEGMGLNLEGRFIHHDQDTVYTGYGWLYAVLINEGARVSFSENGAKGNTTMESFNSHFKRENESLFLEARNIWELMRVIDRQVAYYNEERRHSAHGHVAPQTYISQQVNLSESSVDLALVDT